MQPSDPNTSFDASVLDLDPRPREDPITDSFSTTESAPSDWAAHATQEDEPSQATAMPDTPSQTDEPFKPSIPGPNEPKMPVHYLPTTQAYDAWASVYDTDGNMLQSVDDDELTQMLPEFLALVQPGADKCGGTCSKGKLRIVDFGCGTGRNTAKVLAHPWPEGSLVDVVGVDASKGMLDRAREKLAAFVSKGAVLVKTSVPSAAPSNDDGDERRSPSPPDPRPPITLQLVQHDFLESQPVPSQLASPADAVLTTLVLEHLPLREFFDAVASLLRPGGVALMTNMHADMGRVSQAGFIVDEGVPAAPNVTSSGPVKIRGTSYAHTVDETVDAARAVGLEVIGEMKERMMTQEMIGSVVGERGTKWIGYNVWYGMLLRKK